jgi:hypothetical protein
LVAEVVARLSLILLVKMGVLVVVQDRLLAIAAFTVLVEHHKAIKAAWEKLALAVVMQQVAVAVALEHRATVMSPDTQTVVWVLRLQLAGL